MSYREINFTRIEDLNVKGETKFLDNNVCIYLQDLEVISTAYKNLDDRK